MTADLLLAEILTEEPEILLFEDAPPVSGRGNAVVIVYLGGA